MRVKFLTIGMSLALAFALVTEITAVTALGQDNTNANSSRRRRGRRPPPPPPAATEQAPPEAAPPATETMAAQKPARRRARRRGGAMSMRGVPSGVQNCIDHLIKMAENDPLIDYEGHPSEIINNGLLWNDPKSKCSIGSDASLRLKVSNLATAWSMKDAAKVRSLLQEIKSAAPQ
jgi:hypothetical protein